MDKKYEVSGQNNDTDGPRSSIKPLTEVDLSGKSALLHQKKCWYRYSRLWPQIIFKHRILLYWLCIRYFPDGAGEKMLSNDEKKVSPSSNVDVGDVKFTENQNGDAKLDIGE